MHGYKQVQLIGRTGPNVQGGKASSRLHTFTSTANVTRRLFGGASHNPCLHARNEELATLIKREKETR